MDSFQMIALEKAEERAHKEGSHVTRMFHAVDGWKFVVATPKKAPRIVEFKFNRLWCDCEWSMFNMFSLEVCRHRACVHEFLAAKGITASKLNSRHS